MRTARDFVVHFVATETTNILQSIYLLAKEMLSLSLGNIINIVSYGYAIKFLFGNARYFLHLIRKSIYRDCWKPL